jgi:hypothetical protein
MKKKINLEGFACLDQDSEFISDPSNIGWPLVTLDEYEANALIGTDGTSQVVPVAITIARI